MILYYHAGACSLAVHIALIEAELPYKLISIDRDKRTEDGRAFVEVNARGYVPALELDDGVVLTENLAILSYLANQSRKLLPNTGLTWWRTLEALSFMATEVHANFKPFFKKWPGTEIERARQDLQKHFASLAKQLGSKPFLLGDQMTIADPYLFWALYWAPRHGIEVPQPLQDYFSRTKREPAVERALAEEGLA